MGVVKFFNFFSNTPQKCVSCGPLHCVPQVYRRCGTCGTYLLVPHFVVHIFPTNEMDCSLSRELYCPMTELEIVWKQILMKIVLNERYIILVYIFHTYFWFLSLLEDTRG